jgi:SpoVK/Ycf46/Vps4 family AAA+-type ATPase
MMARIMMHYLKHNCSKLGMKFTPCVVDSSIKDKWYGESEKKLKADFAKVKNPEGIGMMVFDEADAIFSPESNGSLEGSLRGLLLGELEGLSDNEKGNFFSVFITNKPYSGIESALHSRSREFYFKPFEDEASYSKLLDNIFQKSLGDALKQGENKHYDFSEVGKLCLKKQLSGRDVRKAVEGYITQKILLDFPPDLFKQGYEKKKRYFKKRLQNISEREILDYFNNFVEEKSQYEKNEQENAILEMAQRKTWQLISDELARQNMDNLGGKETSYDS